MAKTIEIKARKETRNRIKMGFKHHDLDSDFLSPVSARVKTSITSEYLPVASSSLR